jgi:hypothetical protein
MSVLENISRGNSQQTIKAMTIALKYIADDAD